MENENLAMELLKQLKANGKRWFIAFLTVLVLWFLTIVGFVIYLNQYDVESTTYEQDGNGVNNFNSSITGDLVNESEN